MTGKLTVTVEKFEPRVSNTLRGFCSVAIPQMHMKIHDISIHEQNDKRWIGLPAKAQITRDGTVRRDDKGKVQYVAILEFSDKGTREAFSQRVIASLLEFAPSAFEVSEVA